MVICQTPFRISFFGGGTDYPAWYLERGGAVLSTTINKYGYITCRQLPPFFNHKHRIVYSKIENVKEIGEIEHPSVRAVFDFLGIQDGLELHYDGDLPARSGIGSSSSFTVGLLNTLYAMRGQMISKRDLAAQTIHIEQNVIQESVGSQDQIAAAFGGINRINFFQDGRFEVASLIMDQVKAESLNDHLMLFFTGFSRVAETIAATKINNFKSKQANLHRMKEMVDEAQALLQSRNSHLNDFGRLLHEGWCLKRDLSDRVSNSTIDEIYEVGRKHGAIGGKLLGAGGGGFMLLFVPPEMQTVVRSALSPLTEVPFRFEYSGSQIVLFNPSLARVGADNNSRRNNNFPERLIQ